MRLTVDRTGNRERPASSRSARILSLAALLLCVAGQADGGMQIISGSYTGNGTDNRAISGLGFQPDAVIIKGEIIVGAICRTSTMAGDATKAMYSGLALFSDRIQSLDADGFNIGGDSDVNKNGTTYFWVAFKAAAGELKVGSYTGNGVAGRSIAGVGFQPCYVIVMSAGGSEPYQRSAQMPGDASAGFGTSGLETNRIGAFEADGFKVGSDPAVNQNGTAYHYIAWKQIAGQAGTGTYVGNGIDDRNITGLGFQPQYVIVKADSTSTGVHRTYALGTADRTLSFAAAASFSNQIQAFQIDGFQVGTSNTVNKAGDTYYWAAFSVVTPTAVGLESCEAHAWHDGVLLSWETGWEADNLGFHVDREQEGARTRLTPELVAGAAVCESGAGRPAGTRTYTWWDPDGQPGAQYWLEDVDLKGRRTLHGPVVPMPAAMAVERSRSRLLSELGSPERAATAGLGGASRGAVSSSEPRGSSSGRRGDSPLPGARLRGRREGSSRTPPLPPSRGETDKLLVQRLLAGRAAVKLWVGQEGWYRVTQTALVAAGLDPAADPRCLRMFVNGVERPLLVRARDERRFDREDAVEFYGVGSDTPWTSLQVHWLVADARRGKRVKTAGGRAGAPPGPAAFLSTVELEERTIYFASLRNGDEENFFGAPVTPASPVDRALRVPDPDLSPGRDAKMLVSLQGVSEAAHRVAILFNGVDLGEAVFEAQARGAADVVVPASLLSAGMNVVTLQAKGGELDISLVDGIRLTYWRTYAADGDALRFTARGGEEIAVARFTDPEIRVIDVTDPGQPYQLRALVEPRDGGYCATFAVRGRGLRTLRAFTEKRILGPDGLTANLPSSWRQEKRGAHVVIMSHGDFLESAEALKDLRVSQGWSAAVIDVEDIYDEYNFGQKSPSALKEFLGQARRAWRVPPRFVVLLGDATCDPRDYLGNGDGDFVPTKLIDTESLETASDDWFVDGDGDGLAEMAIGRLPVRTPEEAACVVGKTVGYETVSSGPWPDEVVLVADQNAGFDFSAATGGFQQLLGGDAVARTIIRGQSPTARDELLECLDRGARMVTYIGHGSAATWRGGLLRSADVWPLANGTRLPLLVSLTCLNGFFQDPSTECLAEAFLKAPGGGAVAVWASSALTAPRGQVAMHEEFLRLLLGDVEMTIGEAAREAKGVVDDLDIRRSWILLGDPATRLR